MSDPVLLTSIRARSPKTGVAVDLLTIEEFRVSVLNSLIQCRPDWSIDKLVAGAAAIEAYVLRGMVTPAAAEEPVGIHGS